MADQPYLSAAYPLRERLSATSRLTILTITVVLTAILIGIAGSEKSYISYGGISSNIVIIVIFAAMAMLTVASTSSNIRLGLQMVSIFFFMYLTLPGYHHISINTFPFYGFHYSQRILDTSGMIVFLFFAMFVTGYYAVRRRTGSAGPTGPVSPCCQDMGVEFSWPFNALMLVVSIVSTVVLVRTLGVSGLLATRNVAGNAAASLNTSDIGLLVSLPRNLVFLAFFHAVAAARYSDRRSAALIWLGFQLPLFLFANWPLNLARYVLFGYVLSVFVLLAPIAHIRLRVLLSSLFVVGALFVMPIISAVTRGGQSITQIGFEQQISNFLESGDFDGMQSINNAVIHVEQHGTAWGRQLLSDVLFFVPRSVWAGKGDPSGTLAAKSAGYDFFNISMPLPGEMFIDFGWIGVVLGGVLLGRGLRRLDDWIDTHWHMDMTSRVIGSQLVAFSIILLRGSILAVIGNIVLIIIGSLIVLRFGLRPATLRPAGTPAAFVSR